MMLFTGRVEVLHIDTSIFAYWRNQIGKTTDIDVWQDIETYHFGEIYFNDLFRDRQIRDSFDAKFRELRERGNYTKIYQKYTVLESKPEGKMKLIGPDSYRQACAIHPPSPDGSGLSQQPS